MCSFKSALCLRDRVFVPDYDSHEDMLKELGIKDDYLNASKTFVRVELSPEDGDKSSDPMGWKLKVDQDVRPDWFDPAVDKLRIKQAIADWCAVHVIKDGKRKVRDGVWYACDSATVKAYGSATVEAYDSATVEACDSATVKAYESATVKAYESATVKACDSATVKAYGSATVEAYGSATVKACDSATVKACDSATVILPKNFQTDKPVILSGEAVCVNHKAHTIRSAIKWTVETEEERT